MSYAKLPQDEVPVTVVFDKGSESFRRWVHRFESFRRWVHRYKLRVKLGLTAVAVTLLCIAFSCREGDKGGVDLFYFVATTVTTVGYGDISPNTTASKVFATMGMAAMVAAQVVT